MKVLLTALFGLALSSTSALACGPDTDCVIGERIYRIAMPEGHDGTAPVGAIVYAHGYRGTASGVMKNSGLRKMASRLGVAIIAPKSKGDDWVIPGAPRKTGNDGSTEFAYFDALVADASERFPIDTGRLMMSGFSAGGMMTWNLACHRGNLFAAYAPIAGTFWEPIPAKCPSGPVNLTHTHGLADGVVPLEGRPIADTRQGSVSAALSLARRNRDWVNAEGPDDGELSCTREIYRDGKITEFCLHPGGHSVKSKWIERAWREFEKIGAL